MNFPDIQAAYGAHGVATYPLSGKTPGVRGYNRVGAHGSAGLALKFADAKAGGFCAGRRNGLTIVDIDSTDDRLVAEIWAQLGTTPLEVITPSGGRHLYYRHNGEGRQIRPLPEVDILGAGNVVAAGSVVPKGRYQIKRGGLGTTSTTYRFLQACKPSQRAAKRHRRGSATTRYSSIASRMRPTATLRTNFWTLRGLLQMTGFSSR